MIVRLVLVRNGALSGGMDRQYLGQTADPPLSARGEDDLLARRARGLYPPAQALYTSPLRRCGDTARLLYPMLVPVSLYSLLPPDVGSFEGKSYDQLKDDPSFRKWLETDGETAPPGGESGAEVALRMEGALRKVADDAVSRRFDTAAVVTHGRCVASMLRSRLGEAYLAPETRGSGDYQTVPGGGWLVDMDGETLEFRRVHPLQPAKK